MVEKCLYCGTNLAFHSEVQGQFRYVCTNQKCKQVQRSLVRLDTSIKADFSDFEVKAPEVEETSVGGEYDPDEED